MDDILKRMMAVEAEASEMVKAADAECDRLRSEARKEANAYLAEAQKNLAEESEKYVNDRLAKAREEEKEALRRGDAEMQTALLAFEKKFAGHQREVTEVLLFPAFTSGQ